MDDDVALIWLQDQAAGASGDRLSQRECQGALHPVRSRGDSLKLKFNDPLTTAARPILFVQPEYGTIYTTSTKENAEHAASA